jgi:MFS family permease
MADLQTDLGRAARRIVGSLFLSQSLITGTIIAISTVMSIVAAELTGNPSWAGAPSALLQLSSAAAALALGGLWDRLGRRLGLALSFAVGWIGIGLATAAVELRSVALLGLGILALGWMRAGGQLARFIAAEVSRPAVRGAAISLVVWGGTLGAVGGPLLVGPSSRLAAGLGLSELTGPVATGIPLIALAILVSLAGLRPEPLAISRQIEQVDSPGSAAAPRVRPRRELIRLPGVIVAVVTVVLAQTVMIMLMGITSLHMHAHGHGLSGIALVFSGHTLGMFAFAPLAGWLADRAGRGRVMIAGAMITLLASLLAPASSQVGWLAVSLYLLGLGWSLSFVAGSALLSDQLTPAERSTTQGANDLLLGLASGTASLASGVVYGSLGYGVVSVLGATLMVPAVALSAWWTFRRPAMRPAPAD